MKTKGPAKRRAKAREGNLKSWGLFPPFAPLLGLFGTVLGLDEIFGVMATVGLGDPKSFSGGIAQALRTTILGLAIAMPASIAAGIFDTKVDSMVGEMERLSTILLNKLYASKVRMERGGRLEEFKMRGPRSEEHTSELQ